MGQKKFTTVVDFSENSILPMATLRHFQLPRAENLVSMFEHLASQYCD
jgi:hypothetical protein